MEGWVRHCRYLWSVACWAAMVGLCAAGEADDQFLVAARQYAQARWELAAGEFERFLQEFPEHPRAAEARFFRAEALAQAGRHEDARRELTRFLRDAPDHVYVSRAHYRLGELAHLAGDRATAQSHLAEFLQRAPRDPLAARAELYLGELELAARRYDQAERHYLHVLQQFPQSPEAVSSRLGLADVAIARGQSPLAVGFLQYVLRQGDTETALLARLRLARLYLAEGKLDQAEATWSALSDDPAARDYHEEARVSLARIDAERHQWAKVEERLGKDATGTEGPYAAEVHGLLALAADERGDVDALEKKWTFLREHWPYSPWTERAWWRLLQRLGRNGEDLERSLSLAQAFLDAFPKSDHAASVRRLRLRWLMSSGQYRRVLELAGESPDERLILASAQVALGRPSDALQTLEKVDLQLERPSELVTIADGLRGIALAAIGKHDIAVKLLEPLLDHPPRFLDLGQVRSSLVTAYASLERWEDAEQVLDQWTSDDDQASSDGRYQRAVLRLADALALAGRNDRAAALYQRLSGAADKKVAAGALAGKAWAAFRSGDTDVSLSTLRELIERYPDHPLAPEATWMAGRALERAERPDAALAMYEQVVERYGKSAAAPKALLDAARLHRRLRQTTEAVAALERLIRDYAEDPLVPAAWYELAWNYRDQNRQVDSRQAFETVYKQYRDSEVWADATYRLARLAAESGRYEEAEDYLEDLTRDPARAGRLSSHAWLLAGQLRARREDWEGCRKAMAQAMQGTTSLLVQHAARYWKAESFFREGRWDDAEEAFASLSDDLAEANVASVWEEKVALRLAQIAAHRQEWKLALERVETYRRDHRQEGASEEWNYLEGRCHLGRAEFDKARDAWQRVLQSSGSRRTETAAMAQWMIGESYFLQRRYDEAIRAYLRVEALYPYPQWQAAALLQAGKCYETQGRWKAAMRLYRQVLDQYPETSHRDEAERRWRVARQRQTENSVR